MHKEKMQSSEKISEKKPCNQTIRALVFSSFVVLTACGGSGDDGGSVEALADPSTENNRVARLNNASTWMYQIQDLNAPAAVELLAATDYPMLVIEPGNNFDEETGNYDTPAILDSLRTAPDGTERLILAYVDIGEAEDYRDYWQNDWVAPDPDNGIEGSPDFLITVDPDGWSGNFPVAYWRPEWQDMWTGENGIIKKLASLGFDGIYMDWVEAYDDETVRSFAAGDGINDPDEEMVIFIERLRAAGRSVTRDFLVVAQNAPYLIDYDDENNTSRYTDTIDAMAVEDTWFYGEGDAEWDDTVKAVGDLFGDERHEGDFSTANRLTKYAEYQNKGLPVFSIDYSVNNVNVQQIYSDARVAGLIPLVTQVSLARVTETPPEDF